MLYGRDVERDRIGALLEAARASRSGVLLLRGEPGIGKTALLDDARDRATDMHVLAARGVEAESELPFAALHQLLRPALDHLEALPAPQAAALQAALGLAEGAGEARFLVFAGCLSLLSELAERRPVLCLVDDAQWLDEASADAVRFVARRLDAEGIVILFGVREGEARTFEAPDLPVLEVRGLASDAATALFASRAGAEASHSVRDRLVERAQGNALALVELPSALSHAQLAGADPLPDALPMTRQLESVFLERSRRLPDETRRLLLVAAADDSEDLALVLRAAGSSAALDPAEQAGLVSVHGNRLEFRHPLVRSALYDAATSGDRCAAHRALAAALEGDVTQADRRVWHLASAALEPDEEVLRALDEAAQRAEERNGHVAAAKALERAAALSEDPADRGRRLVRAAANLSLAGRDEQAVDDARKAATLVTDPVLRAQLAEVQGNTAIRGGRPLDTVPILTDAAREIAQSDPARAIELLMVARLAAFQAGERSTHVELARLAGTIEPSADDETSQRLAGALAGFAAMTDGDTSEGVRLLGEVVSWGATTAQTARHILWASFAAIWLGDATHFAALVQRAGAVSRERGELGILADALGIQAVQLALVQRFRDASVAGTEAVELARELGASNLDLLPRTALAIVAAIQGRDDEARGYGEEVVERASANGLRLRASTAVYALALLDLGRARWEEAFERLDSLLEAEAGALDPMVAISIPDKIEAAVGVGRLDDARAALPLFEAWAGYRSEPSAQPRLAACRALIAGEDEATAHFEEALLHSAVARPLDLARIELLFGEHLRRQRRRIDARLHLRAALDGFERLGAEPWAERARGELRASGETARKRDPSTLAQLTPQELHVARFVSEGLSNKQVAAQLFLSPRTIDAHLRSVYAKLGITSRTQLALLAVGTEQAASARAAPVPA